MHIENREIFVFLECFENVVRNSSLELFAAAKSVCEKTGGTISAVILGSETDSAVKTATAYGADRVICVQNDLLAAYSNALYSRALFELISKYEPDAVMISATHNGKDLAPRLARRLRTGITANCVELSVDEES